MWLISGKAGKKYQSQWIDFVADPNYKPNSYGVLVCLGFIYGLHFNISTHSLIFHILDVDHTSWFNTTEGIIIPNALSFSL